MQQKKTRRGREYLNDFRRDVNGSYLYQGKAGDEQTHLGVDIASTMQAEIRAANRGKVVFAEYLGI